MADAPGNSREFSCGVLGNWRLPQNARSTGARPGGQPGWSVVLQSTAFLPLRLPFDHSSLPLKQRRTPPVRRRSPPHPLGLLIQLAWRVYLSHRDNRSSASNVWLRGNAGAFTSMSYRVLPYSERVQAAATHLQSKNETGNSEPVVNIAAR